MCVLQCVTHVTVDALAHVYVLQFVTHVTVDHLAHVSGTLKSELKTDGGKDMFLYYQATSTLLTHVKTTNKVVSRYCIFECNTNDN